MPFIPDAPSSFAPDSPLPSSSFVADIDTSFQPDEHTSFTPDQPDLSLTQQVLAGGARILTPIAGMTAGGLLGGPPGAALGGAGGGALGETIAQQIEHPGKYEPLPIAGEALLGALPFGKVAKPLEALLPATRVGKALATAGEASLFGAGATGVNTLTREGRLPTGEELAWGAGKGAVLGGAFGAAGFKPEAKGTESELDIAAEYASARAKAEAPEQGSLPGTTPPAPEQVVGSIASDEAARQAAKQTEGVVSVLGVKTLEQLAEQAKDLPPEVLANTPAAWAHLRNNRVIADLEAAGKIRPIDTPEGVTDLAQMIRTSYSIGSYTLRSAGGLRNLVDLTDAQLGTQAEKAFGRGLRDLGTSLLNTRRMLMTQMLGTQVRNVASAGITGGLTMLSRMASGLMDPNSRIAAKGLARGFLRPVAAYREGQQWLNALPEIKAQWTREGGMSEGAINAKLQRITRWFNLTLQDKADNVPMNIAFSAFGPESFARRGLDARAFLANPEAYQKGLSTAEKVLFDQATGEAFHNAAAIAFREMPEGPIGKTFVDLVKRFPIATLELPFPRFMASYMNFLSSYGPWGMLKLFAPDAVASQAARRAGNEGAVVFNAADPQKVAAAIGKTTVGTGMLAMALSLRGNPETRGEKSYELKVPGVSAPIDTRPFAPLLGPYLSLADMMLNVSSGKKAFQNLDVKDIAENVLGLSRIEGLGTLAMDIINSRGGTKVARAVDAMESVVGNVLGSFFIPLHEIKDLTGDSRSVDSKANDSMRLLGPTLSNVPFVAEKFDLPQTIKPTTGLPYTKRGPVDVFGVEVPAGILRQLGVSTVEKDKVEKTLNELGVDAFNIAPRTPISGGSPFRDEAQLAGRNTDRRAAEIMGPMVLKIGSQLIDTPGFQKLKAKDPESAKAYLMTYIERIRKSAKAQAEAELALKSKPAYLALQAGKLRSSNIKAIAMRRSAEQAAGLSNEQ